MEALIEQWSAIASFHATALAAAELRSKELSEMTSFHRFGLATAEAQIKKLLQESLPPFATRAIPIVIAMAPEDADWKKFVEKGDVIDNVVRILDECLDHMDSHDFPGFAEAMDNKIKWEEFCLRVIHHLKVKGSFGSVEDGFNDFEDTAGGCDEITWRSMTYLIEHPEWTP